jgi:hypothetical protein
MEPMLWIFPTQGAKGKGAFRALFSIKKQENQTGYGCIIWPDGLFFRNKANARPRSPVPRSRRLLGSGARPGVVASTVKEVVPVVVLVRLKIASVLS